jgi:hypothetical protein
MLIACDGAVTCTDVSTGGAVTVSVVVAETVAEPEVACAVIRAVPTPTAVTSPVAETVATAGADDDQVTVALMVAPNWSLGDAVSWRVPPARSDVAGAEIVTDVSTGTLVGPVGAESPPPLEQAVATASARETR